MKYIALRIYFNPLVLSLFFAWCLDSTIALAQKENLKSDTNLRLQVDSIQINMQKTSKNAHDLQIKAKITQPTSPKSEPTKNMDEATKPKKASKNTFDLLINIAVVVAFVVLSILFIVAMLKLASYLGYLPKPSPQLQLEDANKHRSKEVKQELSQEDYEMAVAKARVTRIRRLFIICAAFFFELLVLQGLFIELVKLIINYWNYTTGAVVSSAASNVGANAEYLEKSLSLDISDAENIINQMLVIIPFLFSAYLLDMFLGFFVWFNVLAASPEEGLPPGESKVPKLIRLMASILIYLISIIIIAAVLHPNLLFSVIASVGASGAIGAFMAKEPVKKAFTALSLNLNKQFKRGDLIEIDGLKGRIADIGWRAIKLKTAENNEIIIPNTTLLESNVVEYKHRVIKIMFPIDVSIPPQIVKDMLLKCVYNSELVTSDPKPNINVVDFQDTLAIYSVEVFTRYDTEDEVKGEILSSIWYMLRREGWVEQPQGFEVEEPVALAQELIDNVEIEITDEETNHKKKVKIFAPFSDEEVLEIAQKAKFLRFGYPERVVVQGHKDTDLYIVAEGTLQVFLKQSDGKNKAIMIPGKDGHLKPLEFKYGSFFGEMSLLGGEPRSATVKAMNDVLVCQISQEILKPIIEKNPAIIKELTEILVSRKMDNLKRSNDYNKSLAEAKKQKEDMLKQMGNAMLSIFVESKPKRKKEGD